MKGTFRCLGSLVLLASGPPLLAQSFVDGAAQIPQGNPFNNSDSENVDFADVDLDGDLDAVFADGGEEGNDQNRLWINQGGLQGGTAGLFLDETAARLPFLQDSSHDADFVDLDLDGDLDLFVSNTSIEVNQPNRFHVNQGGLQGGTAGYFVDETSTRWVGLGVNNGATSFSSIAPSLVLASSGGFIDSSGESLFGDLDGDGDMDLLQTSYGTVLSGGIPSRVFLNDGAGFYEEFNPSGYQLAGSNIPDGAPALWASGLHQHDTQAFNGSEADIAATTLGAELGDLDGDFDLDALIGARDEQPRIFVNRLEQNGGVLTAFADVTYGAFTSFATGNGHYENELGDLDNDNDLDVYGVNWTGIPQLDDTTQRNDGTGRYGPWTVLAGSGSDDNDCEWFDYDNDGDLDVFVANFSGQDRLYENGGPPSFGLTDVTGAQLPGETLQGYGVDACDVDGDGDDDLMVANNANKANALWINVTQAADTHAPRVIAEQAPDQLGASDATPIRALVYDNASWEVIRYYDTVIEYSANGGPMQTAAMRDAGGQSFYGEIPGGLVGVIDYTVVATDRSGNAGVSSPLSFTISAAVNYCTAGISASGCQASLSAAGAASASAPSGFTLSAAGVEGQKDGLFYFGANGRQANPWGNGTSYQCVVPPVARGGLLAGAGTAGLCDGSFVQDLNALWCPSCPKPGKNPGAGAVVQAQLWYRDPLSTSNQTTSLSDAIEFPVDF